ncbi:hypothetical protein HKCCE3408_17745 [Rhodobacterales bacterium HKCCE3408]|nr:hypothetical protein [Rhodobacterales bacterium HKCCE3408]
MSRLPLNLALGALALTGFAVLTTLGGGARADRYDALRADPVIENGLLIAAIGTYFDEHCPSFELREGRARSAAFNLGMRALGMGYSPSEIEAYIDSEDEKARVLARAEAWFQQQGADPDVSEEVCQVARDEIAGDTTIGRLIRER